jgi:hypothetical protein
LEIVPISPDRRAELLTTPFVTSWASLSRPGDRGSADQTQAAAAWAAWLLTALVQVRTSRRDYVAIALDGRVYAGGRLGPQAHLEIPQAVWRRPDPLFPARLAAAGSALRFPSLLYDEVVAVRRAVFTAPTSPQLLDRLGQAEARLRTGLDLLTGQVSGALSGLDLLTGADRVTAALTVPVSSAELSSVLPEAGAWQLRIEPGLVESSGPSLARRLLVWTVQDDAGTVAALTPRLTRSSTISDPLFAPDRESPAACLARLVLLARVARLLGLDPSGVVPPSPPPPGFLRVVPARAGQQTPEASLAAAAAFVVQHPDPQDAFTQLGKLAERRYVLLVDRDRFSAAHRRLCGAVARAEEPEREDVDLVLPLLAGEAGEVVRATFARRQV